MEQFSRALHQGLCIFLEQVEPASDNHLAAFFVSNASSAFQYDVA